MIHTATLLHDDVVDRSDLRRGKQTANAIWDNTPSVLSGDFLYSRAFQLMVQFDDIRILKILADASNLIAEGEVAQLQNCHKPDVSIEDYFKVIEAYFQVPNNYLFNCCPRGPFFTVFKDYLSYSFLTFS